ncbi:MAG TPA: dihydrolipoyl dehydrogenase [Rhodanobacteraceae bacterium]|nr:dihydrolipoyl dehydrogenase [Rhodanobacteraceae bacterium]
MPKMIELKVPDIGDFSDVPVIEVLVKVGDKVEKDQSLVTLESAKATMEVPASAAGVIRELRVKEGDNVSQGSVIAVVQLEGSAGDSTTQETSSPKSDASQPSPTGRGAGGEDTSLAQDSDSASKAEPSPGAARHPLPKGEGKSSGRKPDFECQVCVLGSGPGGYTAAFRAADLGLDTILIERYDRLGGVCLNVGCIPSKALLHAADLINDAELMASHGIVFGKPKIELDKLRTFKDSVVAKLTGGLAAMAKQRKVRGVRGTGAFILPHEIEVETGEGKKLVRFEQCIIAAGSQAVKLPGLPWGDPRVMDSTDALMLGEIPRKLLVIGGGIIGLEMACVYDALGSEVTVVELFDQLMPGTDPDLVRPLQQRIAKRYAGIYLKTKVASAKTQKNGIEVVFEGENAPKPQLFDRVLCAVGRAPNGNKIAADKAGVQVTERGFIPADKQLRTNVPHIFAIGDIVGPPMLAHKATREAKVAAEVCAGHKSAFDARVIPSVAYTDPEVAWVGVTEREAKDKKLDVGVAKFPWAASGRALGIDRSEGFTKLIFDKQTQRIIGGGIVGVHAGDLVSEIALAIEMGAEAADIGLTIHPHPTLSESVGMAAEIFEGTITDLYLPKKK